MKAYLEIIGNEDRPPKCGERFEDDNGSIVVACYDHEEIRRIVTRHEIEIPEGATAFRYAVVCDDPLCNRGQSISLPRPRVKGPEIEVEKPI